MQNTNLITRCISGIGNHPHFPSKRFRAQEHHAIIIGIECAANTLLPGELFEPQQAAARAYTARLRIGQRERWCRGRGIAAHTELERTALIITRRRHPAWHRRIGHRQRPSSHQRRRLAGRRCLIECAGPCRPEPGEPLAIGLGDLFLPAPGAQVGRAGHTGQVAATRGKGKQHDQQGNRTPHDHAPNMLRTKPASPNCRLRRRRSA